MAPVKKAEHVYLRLARLGPRGEGGLNSYYYEGRIYKRSGIYQVNIDKAKVLLSTGKFERIHDMDQAQREAKGPRGRNLNAANRAKRREAQMRKRRQVPEFDDDEAPIDTSESGDESEGEGITV